MTVDDYQGKMLQNSIESIVFPEEEIENLKHVINELPLSKPTKEIIIKIIIQFGLRIIKELKDFIPYYFKHLLKSQNIENISNNSKLKKELEERNEFLEIIDRKIEEIYKKLAIKHSNSGY